MLSRTLRRLLCAAVICATPGAHAADTVRVPPKVPVAPRTPFPIPLAKLSASVDEMTDRVNSVRVAFTGQSDYAVITGIQIHSRVQNYVWPGAFYAVVEGERTDLSFKD